METATHFLEYTNSMGQNRSTYGLLSQAAAEALLARHGWEKITITVVNCGRRNEEIWIKIEARAFWEAKEYTIEPWMSQTEQWKIRHRSFYGDEFRFTSIAQIPIEQLHPSIAHLKWNIAMRDSYIKNQKEEIENRKHILLCAQKDIEEAEAHQANLRQTLEVELKKIPPLTQ